MTHDPKQQNPGKGQTNQQVQGDNPALRKDENKRDQAEGGQDRGQNQGGQGQGAGFGRNVH